MLPGITSPSGEGIPERLHGYPRQKGSDQACVRYRFVGRNGSSFQEFSGQRTDALDKRIPFRHLTIGGQLIDDPGQKTGQAVRYLALRYTRLQGKLLNLFRTQSIDDLLGGNRLVCPRTDP